MEYRFDFDENLPDLPTAFDLEAIEELFNQRWPGHPTVTNFPVRVKVDRLQDIKYRPMEWCVTTYEIQVEQPDQLVWPTIGVVEIRPEGITHRLFDADPKLPWLALAIDAENMRGRFADLLLDLGSTEAIESLEIVTVRYKPGNHCVFRYDVTTASSRQVFYGKLFSEDGDWLADILSNAYLASQELPDMPRIPRPLAYWPDLRLLVQPAVAGGIEFRNFSFDSYQDIAVREEWMYRAGVSTAALHASHIPGGKRPIRERTFQDELTGLEEYTSMMARVHPKLEVRFRQMIAELAEIAGNLVEPPAVTGHGALRTDQFILQGDHLVMIDMDSICRSNPARDLGNFLAYMCWKAIRQPEHGAFVERAGQEFLDGYLNKGGEVDDLWLGLYQAASLLKIAGRRFRSLTFREWPLVSHLLDAAAATLTEIREELARHTLQEVGHRQILHLSTATNTTKFPATFIDTEFPALWFALNAEMMNDNLTRLLGSIDCLGDMAVMRNAKLLAYKPGKRGVIRYEASGHGCEEGWSVLGKLYPAPYLAERAYKVMQALDHEVFAGIPYLGISRPLGLINELSMLVFLPAEGRLLGDVIAERPKATPKMMQIMDMASTWLATFHQHPLALEKQFQISNEVDNIQEWVELISRKFPEEVDAAQEIARYLLDRLDKLPFETKGPIHKDFHYEHILVDGGLKVIDFDEVRLGDPNLDLAHFCANFYLLAYRKNSHPVQFARLQHRFLETYARHSGWSLDERFVFFYAYSCLKLAKQICKKRGPRPFPEGEEQRGQVWLMLEQGLTTLLHTRTNSVTGEFPLPIMDFSKERRTTWSKATRISKSDTSSAATRVSHKLLS
jgi:aminoglycoside phosphotransferase (APT) family kinase protein